MSSRAIAVAAIFVVASSARAAVLYDGSLGTSPTNQGLTYSQASLASGPFYSSDATGTTLNTNATTPVYAGFGTNAISLDRTRGFTLRVDAKVLSESHVGNNDRAGFSLLVVSGDLKAIEIGFHANEIFSQNSVTTTASRGESVAFDTTAALTEYDLVVLDNNYTLKANGASILTGALRDYTNFGGAPYTVPNSVFLGDDTSSAQGSTRFTFVSVPEPISLSAVGAIALFARRRLV